jgi:hypothetical protein
MDYEGGRYQAVAFEVPATAPRIVRLMFGTPRFKASKFEYFVLCLARAIVAPLMVLLVPALLCYALFGRAGIESIGWAVFPAFVFAFFEEHARLTFARAIDSLLAGALMFSLGLGALELVLFLPFAEELSGPVGSSWYYVVVRSICLAMHLSCGFIVGFAAQKRDRRSIIIGLAIATTAHALFNLFGVGKLLADWLVVA